MNDGMTNAAAPVRSGTTLTSLVDRLGSRADINRQGQTARPEFSGLLDALATSEKASAPERVHAPADAAPATPTSPLPAPVSAPSARDAARTYQRTASALER